MSKVIQLPPHHGDPPKYWMHETSSVLATAMKSYLDGRDLTAEELDYLKSYLWQWVKSPAWYASGLLEPLRLQVAAISCQRDLEAAIEAATQLGIDPL